MLYQTPALSFPLVNNNHEGSIVEADDSAAVLSAFKAGKLKIDRVPFKVTDDGDIILGHPGDPEKMGTFWDNINIPLELYAQRTGNKNIIGIHFNMRINAAYIFYTY
jgi:hypothetical protein